MEFDPYSYQVHDDPYPIYRWLRDEAPVWRNDRLRFWTLARHQDVLAASLDPATFSSSRGTTLENVDEPLEQPMMINMDPPEHTAMRSVVNRVFTPRRIAELEDFIRTLARGYLEPLAAQGHADMVKDFSAQVPINVISELLGLPTEIRDQVRDLSDELLAREPDQTTVGEANRKAAIELAMLLAGEITTRRTTRTDDVIGMLVDADLADADGTTRPLNDMEVIGFCILLSVAGNETVTKLMANAAVALSRFPEQRQALIDDPSLIPNAVEEALRWEAPSQYQGRYLLKDATFHGTTMPAGDFVLLLTGAANHDDRVYPKPEQFDVKRKIERPLGLGFGVHLCLGASLARLETRIAIEEWLRLMPDFQVDEDNVVRMHSSNVRGLSSVPITFTPR